jgi:hypothetical protein
MSTPCSIWWKSTPLMPPCRPTPFAAATASRSTAGDGEDAGAVQPLLHARADAVDVLQVEAPAKCRANRPW